MPSLQEEIKAPFLKAYSSTASQNYSPCPSFRHSFNPSWFCISYHCPLFETCTSVYISELAPKPTSIYYVISLKTVCVREFLHCGVTLIPVLLLNRTQDLKKKKKLSQSSFVYPFFGEGNGNPLQYSCLENSTDRGAWWATIRGVAKGQTRLSTAATHSLVKSSDV